ncbi:unnamed protein product [Parnassius mnemosyne]|uniref:Uncharacterized protein n=1 Tax=Parnassius mnemosyne TaxID=213953 RepID=A0AAV1MB33_9NEOP
MGDRDNGALLPFAAGVAVGAVLTALGFKFMYTCPQPVKQTQQVGAVVKCTCKKDGKDDCQIHCIRNEKRGKCPERP